MPQPWEIAGKQPWEIAAGTQVKQAPPAYPYEGPTAAAGLTGKTIENKKAGATLPYDIVTARNQATSSGIKAKSDQIDLNIKTGTPPGDPSKSGAAYLNSLPAGVRDLTQAMLSNRYPAVINRNIPVVNQAVLAANHMNPAFDATKYNMRVSLMNHTMAGSDADELKALNTAITHAGVLYDQTAKLPGGADYGPAPLTHAVNGIENWLHSTSPGYKNFLDTMQKYGQEESKTYAINAQSGQQQTQANYDLNDPGKTIQSNIKNDISLMAGRAAAIINKYNIGNAGQAPLEPLSPDAREVLQRLAPDVLVKQFSQKPDPMAQAMGITLPGGGGNQPPPAQNSGITPPPTGPAGTIGPSSNGVSDSPDPKSEAFWEGAARQGTPYIAALRQWQQSLPPGASSTPPDPKAYASVVAYMAKNPNVDYHPVQGILRTPLSGVSSAMNDLAQSPVGSFSGHAFNAASLGLPALAAGDKGALFNTVSGQQNPKASTLGDIAGTIAGSVGVGKGVQAAAPSLGTVGRMIGGTAPRAALTGDTVYGGVTGAADNPDHPVMGGIMGAASMDAGNAAGRYILGPTAAAIADTAAGRAVVNRARSLGGLVSGAKPAPFSPPQAPEIGLTGATQKALPDITGKLQQAQSAGLPYTLADADPRLRAMLGSATRFSPDVRATAENILQPRQAGQGERAIAQINQNLAPVGDVPTLQASLLKSAQSKSGPLYEAAKSQPIPELTAYPKFKEILDRPAGQSAMRSGYETALNKGEDVGTLTYATDPQGNPVQYGNPSWNVIHYARQALDKSGDTDVRQALDKQIALINPGFKKADAAYSTTLKGSDALQAGVDATGIKVTPEATQRAMAGFPNNGAQFQQGYASNMADQIERQRFTGNPYNLVNGSMGQQAKLGMVFPNGAPNFSTAHALEGDMAKTYQGVLGNSATQGRAMDDKLFSLGDMADTGLDLGAAAVTGTNPLAGLMGLGIRKGIDAAKFGMGRAKADAVAPFLMNPDPGANLAALSRWAQQNAARKAYLSQVGTMGGQLGAGLFGAPAISLASQN